MLIIFRSPIRPIQTDGLQSLNVTVLQTEAMEGNQLSAMILHNLSKICGRAPASKADLEAQIDNLQQTHSIKSAGNGESAYLEIDEDVTSMIDQMRQSYDTCQIMRDNKEVASQNWLEIAAQNGSTVSMVDLANLVDDESKALELHTMAWENGDVSGLLGIYEAHNAEFASGESPSKYIDASAALIAYTLIFEKRLLAMGRGIGERHAGIARKKMDDYLATLRPQDVAQASKLAREIVVANPNCCLSF